MFDEYENTYPKKPILVEKTGGSNASKYILILALVFLIFNTVDASNYWVLLCLIGVVAIHELGHFLGMKYFGYDEPNFIFYTLLAKNKTRRFKPISQRSKVLTLQLGPVPGVIAGCILFYYALGAQSDIFLILSLILIGVNLFSLLPIDPLDGGKIIKNLFFPIAQKPYLIFVLVSSLAVIIIGYFTSFYMLMLLGFLMGIKVRNIQKNMLIYDELENQEINYFKSYKSLTDREYWKIRNVFLDFNPRLKNIIPSRSEVWENENLLSSQIRQLLKEEIKLDIGPVMKVLTFMFYLACLLVPLYLLQVNFDFIVEILQKVEIDV